MRVGSPPLESAVVVANDGQESFRFRIDDDFERVVIGRSRLNEAPVSNAMIGRRHCVLTYNQVDGLVIADSGSVNGTWLNGVRIDREAVSIGDLVIAGLPARGVQIYVEHTVAGEGPPSNPLLQTILADPDDLDARLVYADWLDQQGDPRGELIRYQIAAKGVPEGDPRRRELEERIRALLQTHEATWIAPLPVPVVSWAFGCGFIEEVQVGDPATIADVTAALRPYHPIRRVSALLPGRDRAG